MRARYVLLLRALIALAGVLPWALSLARLQTPAMWLSFHALCHQMPERTLWLSGEPMLVCSRCAGMYAGIALGTVIPLRGRLASRGALLIVAAVALAVLDVVTQDTGLHEPWLWSRLATGLAMGWTASAFVFAALAAERARVRPIPARADRCGEGSRVAGG